MYGLQHALHTLHVFDGWHSFPAGAGGGAGGPGAGVGGAGVGWGGAGPGDGGYGEHIGFLCEKVPLHARRSAVRSVLMPGWLTL